MMKVKVRRERMEKRRDGISTSMVTNSNSRDDGASCGGHSERSNDCQYNLKLFPQSK
jgi:hypothetical protein